MSKNLKKSYLTSQLKQTIHDLNNIFTSTISSVDVLEDHVKGNKKASQLVATIKNNSIRAIDVINNLSSGSNKQKSKIDVTSIISDIELTTKSTISKNIKLTFRFGKNLNKVYANYTDLYRVFLNLIVNATESIGDSGSIVFSVKNNRKKDFVLISIKDNGIGISKQKLKNIFVDGYTTKDKNTNSGFGLSIVKKIIEEHNGSLEVSSKVKSGTEFLITLPAIEKTKIEINNKVFSKILLADDDPVILELFSDLLTSYNYDVDTAADGKRALSKFKKGSFDITIIDKIMPKMDGIECIEQIRKMDSKVPIILTTGSQDAIEEEYLSLDINKKIKKPWNFEDMLEAIQTLLG